MSPAEMSTRSRKSSIWCHLRNLVSWAVLACGRHGLRPNPGNASIMNPRLLLLLALISAVAMIGKTEAATRIAVVGTGNGVENVLDAAMALMSKDTDLQF